MGGGASKKVIEGSLIRESAISPEKTANDLEKNANAAAENAYELNAGWTILPMREP
jgi:hypothetical protein